MCGYFQPVLDNPATVSHYIADEVAVGRLEPAPLLSATTICKNPIGIIPKPHQTGDFQLIEDLSAPQVFSVKNGISLAL